MRADGGRLLEHADVEVGFQLLQPDGARQPCRSGPDDDDVIFHDVPLDVVLVVSRCVHYCGCMRTAPSSRMVSPFNIGISKAATTSRANSSGFPRRLGKGIWLAREACSSALMESTMGVWKMPGAMERQRMPNLAS